MSQIGSLRAAKADRGLPAGADRIAQRERLERATSAFQPPFAVVDLDALWANAADMELMSARKPIRLASKSVRCRPLQERVLARPGFTGTLAFTLAEALWLSEHGMQDILVAYPTMDVHALAKLARLSCDRPQARIAVMVDCVEHVEMIEVAGAGAAFPVRVCIDVDAGFWMLRGRLKIGAKRSPVHTVAEAIALAKAIASRPAVRLIGVMAYEAQIAGLGDAPPRRPLRSLAIRAMQARSASELAERRAEIVEAVRQIAPLELVNGGGTGSLASTASEPAVTELGAGSGLYGPTLFDAYRAFRPRPAALFALPIVRKPSQNVATALGGGYLASGPADAARLPSAHLPAGLHLDSMEGAGEVQTPLIGKAAPSLSVGDRVWLRHCKAGELCERFDTLLAVKGDEVVEELPTYRGEGQCFL